MYLCIDGIIFRYHTYRKNCALQIEFIKAPQKYGVRKIPTYRTTISGISDKDITPINDISMKVFKWNQEDL